MIWAAAITAASSFPGTAYPRVDVPMADKLVHAFIYGVLGALCARALMAGGRATGGRVLVLATLVAGLFGVTDEVHQAFVPRRSPDVRDVVADLLGALIGAGLMLGGRWWWSRRTGPPPEP